MRKILTVFVGTFVFLIVGEKSNACTPTPNFTSSATSINQGQAINFTSTGGAGTPAATSWTWTFPGGTPGTSTAQHPAGIVYNTPGIYDVTHCATNTYTPPTGCTTKTAYITVWTIIPPNANTGLSISSSGNAPGQTAIIDADITDKGILIPRLTTAQRNAIPSPAAGLILYNSITDSVNFFNGANWQRIDGKQVSTSTGSGTLSSTGIAINTTGAPADPSAILDVSSSDKGMLLPRTMKTNILSPVQGLVIYDTYYNTISFYDGANWQKLCSSLSSATTGAGSLPVQGIAINPAGTAPDASAILDLNVTDKGFLLPRLTDAQRDNIIAPVEGLIIYNITSNRINYYSGSAWYGIPVGVPAASSPITGTANICPGINGVVYSVSDITDATSYVWSYTGIGFSIASGANTSSITANFSVAATSGNLTVRGANGCGNGASSATYSITIGFTITAQPSNSTICESLSTNFSVTTTGGGLTYQWQVSTDGGSTWGDIIAAGSNPTYSNWTTVSLGVNTVVIGNNGYQYRCVVSNGTCTPVTSNTGTLTVNSSSPTYVCAGSGTFVDARDGQTYGYVDIAGSSSPYCLGASQRWMCQNLNIGTMIPVSTNQTNNAIIEKYSYNNDLCNSVTYGGLYQWDEMMNYGASNNGNGPGPQGICPVGWHIPTQNEWKCLRMNLGLTQAEADYMGGDGSVVGGKLKETGTTLWVSPNTGATNSSGFTGRPAGIVWAGEFANIGTNAWWWTTTDYSTGNIFNYVQNSAAQSGIGWQPKNYGASVRCVKD